MSFCTPVENPGTRPPRSWAFDIGCALLAAAAKASTAIYQAATVGTRPPVLACPDGVSVKAGGRIQGQAFSGTGSR